MFRNASLFLHLFLRIDLRLKYQGNYESIDLETVYSLVYRIETSIL